MCLCFFHFKLQTLKACRFQNPTWKMEQKEKILQWNIALYFLNRFIKCSTNFTLQVNNSCWGQTLYSSLLLSFLSYIFPETVWRKCILTVKNIFLPCSKAPQKWTSAVSFYQLQPSHVYSKQQRSALSTSCQLEKASLICLSIHFQKHMTYCIPAVRQALSPHSFMSLRTVKLQFTSKL